MIDALAWKYDLVKHDKLLIAVLASLVFNVLVFVVVHQTNPLLGWVPEYFTANSFLVFNTSTMSSII